MVTIPRAGSALDCIRLDVAIDNWPSTVVSSAFGLPTTQVWLSHKGSAINVLFAVVEDGCRGTLVRDQQAVYQDSCVELFIAFPQAGTGPDPGPAGAYYNFEFNCLGFCLAAYGNSRLDRQPVPQHWLDRIVRRPSIGTAAFGYRSGIVSWELAVSIPVCCLFRHQIVDLAGLRCAFNLYKCGDGLPHPHYRSWSRVAGSLPDFHQPKSFAPAIFAG